MLAEIKTTLKKLFADPSETFKFFASFNKHGTSRKYLQRKGFLLAIEKILPKRYLYKDVVGLWSKKFTESSKISGEKFLK